MNAGSRESSYFEVSFAKSPKYSLDLVPWGCKTHNVHPGKLGGVIILG
jgi:hypothetical protein